MPNDRAPGVPGMPGVPPPLPPPPPPRRRGWVTLVAVLAIGGLVAGSFAAAWTSTDESDPAPGRGDDPEEADRPSDVPPASEAEVREAVDEISAAVERERGLSFREPVEVDLAGEGEFQRRLLEDFDEDVDELRRAEVVFQALGLVGPDIDLVESMRELLGAGVVGFYDPETDELVVRGTALTPYVRTTIAHELTHALDDQHFDLDRPEYDDADDEVGFGFSAVVEGNARRVEAAYRDSLSREEQEDATAEELELGAGIDLGGVPTVLVELIAAPYGLGETFVDELLASGGQRELDDAFADPPRTSEQVIDAEAYREGEGRIEVPVPSVPGEVVEDGVAGQVLIQLVLASEVGAGQAAEAAVGWGGDWAVAWRDGDRSCATLSVVGDDAGETAELRAAFEEWADARADDGSEAAVEPGESGTVTVEACS